MRISPTRNLTLLAVLLLAVASFATPAAARESRILADRWTMEVGFVREPATQADTNGLWLRVMEGDQPVEGLEQTLQAEVIYGDAVRALPLIPVTNEPGTYTSTFIPVQPGDYTFRIFGTLGDVTLDEFFTSAPEGVAPVDPRLDYEFPTTAQGWAPRDLAMPAAAGILLLAFGAITFIARGRKP